MHRNLSVSEAAALFDCSWRHDLSYGDQLAGSALVPRDVPVLLREGKAWGRGVAALHAGWGSTTQLVDAADAIRASIREDAVEREALGLYDPEHEAEVAERLLAVLAHYYASTEPLPIHHPETHLLMALPATQRHSNRYRLEVYLDGLHDDAYGTWVVEYKWRSPRSGLADYEVLVLQRQLRWYAWAWREHTGVEPTGVIVDERIGEPPSEVRYNQDGSVSKVQSCTPEAYVDAGGAHPETLERLYAKQWQARRRITFRPGELDWAGRELRTLARLVQLYDSGQLAPVRNPNPRNCRGCPFRAICQDPWDSELVDALYSRQPPKRERAELSHAA